MAKMSDAQRRIREIHAAHCRYRNYGKDKPANLPGAPGDVYFLRVGCNASHGFYLGWDSEGTIWRASVDESGDLDEPLEYRCTPIPGGLDAVGYIGHY